ncbi:twin-arginine translocation signal domain-containing protein [Actibacterium lipolyticum]|uniref:Twin-arginine translocation pathway signal protein n=1 Tax=Actibacterium lipolyticum TaxID=1524263 RepID=A0A238KNB8_9RHOB|nr:twin-arginine translocation signal domain-containing protein [Actibacterium lipolyticum]SMX44323.1 hypothetical protein COL8621_02527 [Actibacterium lipolyticum]
MGKKSEDTKASRRDFLKLASVSAPAAAVAVAMTGETAEAASTDSAGNSTMQDTAHTRAYFETARF